MSKCFYCNKEIENENPSIIGVDIPYINLPFHKKCFDKIKGNGEEKYLQENKKRIFELAKKT